jgi:hypothetical protein
MNVMAIVFVSLLTVAACGAMGVLAWGLILEARANREWRERGLVP